MHSGKKPQCILVKSDEFENSYSLFAAARASLERASKAADLIGTGTKIFDFYPQCIWIFYHNALHSHCPNDVMSLVQCLRRLRLVNSFFVCVSL